MGLTWREQATELVVVTVATVDDQPLVYVLIKASPKWLVRRNVK